MAFDKQRAVGGLKKIHERYRAAQQKLGKSPTDIDALMLALRGEMLPNLRWLIPMSSPATKHDWPYIIRERG